MKEVFMIKTGLDYFKKVESFTFEDRAGVCVTWTQDWHDAAKFNTIEAARCTYEALSKKQGCENSIIVSREIFES